MKMELLSGAKYVSLFVDAFSRKMWVYFLNLKLGMFIEFKKFKALVENQSRKSIKVIRLVNDREFCFEHFLYFYIQASIKRQYTTPYTPKQNGVVEVKSYHYGDG